MLSNPVPPVPRTLSIPLELCSLILNPVTEDTELGFLEKPDQVYGKSLHGKTKVSFKNGNSYEGEFENGMLHGRGIFTWTNGVKYEGDFFYNRLIGSGRFDWPDGSFYEGGVNYGLREGKGSFVTPNNEASYAGDWLKGMRHGLGKLVFKSGGVYEGDFANGNKHGKGKMVYATGNFYEGDWQFDKKRGHGVMHWAQTREKYYGGWDDNRQNGLGVHIWLENKGEGKFLRNRYEGEWDSGQRHGFGAFYYANGARYEGTWNRNLKDGYALFMDETGKERLAVFKADKIIKEFDIIPKVVPTLAYIEQTFENNLELVKEILETGQPQEKKKDERASSSQNKSKPTSPSMKKKTRILSGKKTEAGNEGGKKEVDANPFYSLINIEDILLPAAVANKDLLMKNLTNMLLRHNPFLRKVYKHYTNVRSPQPDDSFDNENVLGLNMHKFWVLLRDVRVMSPRLTVSIVNRIFYQGAKNRFEIKVPVEELKRKMDILKTMSETNHFPTLDPNELFVLDFASRCSEEGSEFAGQIAQNINIHDGGRVLLYRQFVDLIVRVAYLKYGDLNELHRSVEKLVTEKMEPMMENKKKKNKDASFHSTEHMGKVFAANGFREELYHIFKARNVKRQNLCYGIQDETILLKTCIELLNGKNANLLQEESDRNILFHFFERYYDLEESFSHLEHQIQSMLSSQMTMSIEKKDKEKKNTKEREKEREAVLNKNKKIGLLVEAEILFEEFCESLTYFFLKKKPQNLRNDEEIDDYLSSKFQSYISVNRKMISKARKLDGRIWPYSEKDKMFEVVKVVRHERMLEEQKRKEELRIQQQEEFERNLMNKEDKDVNLNEEEEEEEEYEESDQSYL